MIRMTIINYRDYKWIYLTLNSQSILLYHQIYPLIDTLLNFGLCSAPAATFICNFQVFRHSIYHFQPQARISWIPRYCGRDKKYILQHRKVSMVYLTKTLTALLLLVSTLVTAFDNHLANTFAQGLTSPLEEAKTVVRHTKLKE